MGRSSARTGPTVNARFPSNTIVRMVDTVKTLNRPTDVADVQAFFSEHPIEQAAKTLEQILERQRVNAALREREQDAPSPTPLRSTVTGRST